MEAVPSDICEIIERSFKEDIKNFEVTVHTGNKKGEGFIGNIVFLSTKHKTTGKEDHLAIKQVATCDVEHTRDFFSSSYFSEIHFYSEVWPALQDFKKSFPKSAPSNMVPKFYGFSLERGKEKVMLENLKYKNFRMHPKEVPFDDEMLKEVFILYGQYHALSFAFKHYRPNQFLELSKPLKNNWLGIVNVDFCNTYLRKSIQNLKRLLEEAGEKNILKKLQPYIDNVHQQLIDCIQYNGPNSIFIHGDAWSNNMLFKYNIQDQLEDIKLLDHQFCMVGSPVYDIEYLFYTATHGETLKNWEYFLKAYYISLTEYLKEFNLDSNLVYPYDELKKEWKELSRFSFIIGLAILGFRFTDEEDAPDGVNVKSEEQPFFSKFHQSEEYTASVLNLVRHFYENDFLSAASV